VVNPSGVVSTLGADLVCSRELARVAGDSRTDSEARALGVNDNVQGEKRDKGSVIQAMGESLKHIDAYLIICEKGMEQCKENGLA